MFDEFNNFQPIDFLNVAKELYSDLNEDNQNISAIKRIIYGRIYYATFLFLREWLIKNEGYKSYRDHENVPKAFVNKGPFGRVRNKQISKNLKRLKKLRHQADYFITRPLVGSEEYKKWIPDNIDDAFDLAEDIFNSFN